MSITTWRDRQAAAFGVTGESDFVVQRSLKEKRGIVTANLTTPYIFNFISLGDGPLEIDYPAGLTAGGILDFWQRPSPTSVSPDPTEATGASTSSSAQGWTSPPTIETAFSCGRAQPNNIGVLLRILDEDPAYYETFKATMKMGRFGQPMATKPFHRRQRRRMERDRPAWTRLLGDPVEHPRRGTRPSDRQGVDGNDRAAGHREG